jgi:uncharacterized protein (TIGR03435 family)
MTIGSPGSLRKILLSATGCLALASQLWGQLKTRIEPNTETDVVKMFHPTPPLPSYEVASIRRADPTATPTSATTIRNYILSAYGTSTRSQAQLVGGPAWVSTETYVIQAKAAKDLQSDMQTITRQQQSDRIHMMQQSLLADRFKLKMHFEIRQLPILVLSLGKGGLTIKTLPPPPAPALGEGSQNLARAYFINICAV